MGQRRVIVAVDDAAFQQADRSALEMARRIERLVPTGAQIIVVLTGLPKQTAHDVEHEVTRQDSLGPDTSVILAATAEQVALIAEHLAADDLLYVSDADAVHETWPPIAGDLGFATLTVTDARTRGLTAGHGGGKIEGGCRFVERTGHRAVIGSFDHLMALYLGGAGTTIVDDGPSTIRVVAPRKAAPCHAETARRALALLDLTELSEICDDAAVESLCTAALDGRGHVAAVCVWPRFVTVAHRRLAGSDVRIAAVVNFPEGTKTVESILAEAAAAVADGADELDLVLPWRAFLAGDEGHAIDVVTAVRQLLGPDHVLKVILESGLYPDQASVARAAQLAVNAGADFLKTSTGKAAISATPEAVVTLLHVIACASRSVGIKPSGGIRTLEDATRYLALADDALGASWATPSTFRFGASALHGALLSAI